MFKWSNVPVGRADPNAELVGGKQGIKFTRTIVKSMALLGQSTSSASKMTI
jgi:hypothetical protein